jgi:hypothetical protein
MGIKPENLDKLFGDFAQFDQVANRGIEGTGLGLAISRNLATLMGGNIEVKSEYGKGSEFVATVVQKAKDGSGPVAALKNPDQAAILIVEPREEFRRSIRWTLERLGPGKLMEAEPEWRELLSDMPGDLGQRLREASLSDLCVTVRDWGAFLFYCGLLYERLDPGARQRLISAMAPAFLARFLTFQKQTLGLSVAQVEAKVEEAAEGMEKLKKELLGPPAPASANGLAF